MAGYSPQIPSEAELFMVKVMGRVRRTHCVCFSRYAHGVQAKRWGVCCLQISIVHSFLKCKLLPLFSCSVVSDSATLWIVAWQASLSFTTIQNLFRLMSIESVMPSDHLIPCRLLLLLPPIFPSVKVVSSESAVCVGWPKYWCLSFSISPFNEYSGFISFKIDWFDLLAVQGTLKSLLQQHSSKASVLLTQPSL